MMTHSREELELMLDKTYEEVDTFLETNPQYEVRPSNAVEEKLHRDKVITDEEFVELLTGKRILSDLFGTELIVDDKNNITDKLTGEKYSADKLLQMKNNSNASSQTENKNQALPPTEQGASPGETQDASTTTKQPTQAGQTQASDPPLTGDSSPTGQGESPPQTNSEKISAKIAQMYVLKSTFTTSLDALYNNAIAKYNALPASQKENGKTAIVDELYPKAAQLEKDCDAQVKTVLADLTILLKAEGQSLDLIDTIRTAYYQEKSVRKAMYMEKL